MRLRERGGQLAVLRQYAEEARAGHGRLVLVSGEAGVGKSTLVEAFEEAEPGARFLWGACDGQFTPRPLGPLVDIAAQTNGRLAAAYASSAPREALFRAALADLADHDAGLTVVVLEDAHWADEATLDLLRFLGRRLRDARTVLVVTYRDDDLTHADPLLIVLGELSSQRTTRRLAVPPLTRRAVDELAADGPVTGEELYRLTRGNPFFIREVLSAAPGELPPSARDAVLARLARLDPGARRYAEAAALVGTRADLALLAEVVDEDPETLDDAVASRLLVGDGRTVGFVHELARVAVEQQVPTQRRAGVHARLLAALTLRGDVDEARLAHHAEGANDRDAVLALAPRAARRASGLGSHREAALQYERALRFADGEPDAVRADLLGALAQEQSLVDRWEEAAVHAERALELWRAVGDPDQESGAQRFLSRVMWRLNRGVDAARYAEEAYRTVADRGPSPALAWATATLGQMRHNACRYTEALELAREAGRMAEELDLPDLLSDALNNEACTLSDLGGDWLPVMRRAVDVAREHGFDSQAGRGYANIVANLAQSRRYSECDRWFREGVAYCEEKDVATYGTCLRSAQAEVDLEVGQWARAERLSREVLARPDVSPANLIMPTKTLGRLLTRRGDPEGMAFADRAVAMVMGTGDAAWILDVAPSRVEAHWLAGDLDSARADLAALEPWSALGTPWQRGWLAAWRQRLGEDPGETGDAGDLAPPYLLCLRGDHEGAAKVWEGLFSPFEAALERYDAGTEESLRAALEGFESLGAAAAALATRRRLRDLGVRSVPTGARASTREHPAGLTRREGQVLEELARGLTNDEIASRLVISAKTVDHHVSAVLAKLHVPTRRDAVREAGRLGLLTAGPGAADPGLLESGLLESGERSGPR